VVLGLLISALLVVGAGCDAPKARPAEAPAARGPLYTGDENGASSLAFAGHYHNASLTVLYNRGVAPVHFDSIRPDVYGHPAGAKMLATYLPSASSLKGPSTCAGCPGANDDGGGPTTQVVGWPPLGSDGPLSVAPISALAPMDQVHRVTGDPSISPLQPALLVFGGILLNSSSTCVAIDGFTLRYHTGTGRRRRSYAEWFPLAWAVCREDLPDAQGRLDTSAKAMFARVSRKREQHHVQLLPDDDVVPSSTTAAGKG
jgi:hypothetical protein